MKMNLKAAVLTSLLLLPTLALAGHYSDFYVIPVVSKTAGVNGTNWMSDVAIQNFTGAPLNVSFTFIASGQSTSDNVFSLPAGDSDLATIAPGGSLLIQDVLKSIRPNGNAIGALLVGANAPFAVTSRSYSMTPAGDTVGQTVLPARDFIENTIGITNNAMAVAYIPGLIQNARFRTNLGFVAGSSNDGGSMGIEFRIKNSQGVTVGTRNFSIAPGNFTHVQFSSSSVSPSSYDIGAAEVRITTGSGAVVPYASVIDNVTADAVYVSGTFPPNAVAPKASVPSIFRTLHESLRKN